MKINYTIKLELPAVSASIGTIGKDTDIIVKKNFQGKPFFSGKHIKGILRSKVFYLKRGLGVNEADTTAFINKYFGKEGNIPFDEKSYKLRFSNLNIDDQSKYNIYTRYGIEIDRKNKTAKEGSLFDYEFIEKGTLFNGSIIFPNDIEKEDLKFLLASLYHIDFIGGLKSRGLGKVKVLIENKGIDDLDTLVDSFTQTTPRKIHKFNRLRYKRYSYVLTLNEPVVVTHKEVGNYIYTRNVIQGSTIRGALINYFKKIYNVELEKLLPIQASSANYGRVHLASEFKTKYKINDEIERRDKVVFDGTDIDGIKLERDGEDKAEYIGNEISIGINNKTRSVEDEKLFNLSYIEDTRELKGDVYIPEEFFDIHEDIILYLGKVKSKGFGKVTMNLIPYIDNKDSLKSRVEELNKLIGDKDNIFITFDLQSDLVLPFNLIYDIGQQFKLMTHLNEHYKFQPTKSFITTDTLQGYNIINNTRKMDELILTRGSVLTYSIPKSEFEKQIDMLKKIEEHGCGLRKSEGFGRINICTSRDLDIINPKQKHKIIGKISKGLAKECDLFHDVIEKHFKPHLENLNPAQMNRFHSVVKNRNYYMDSKKIEDFVNKQIDRGEKNINNDLKKAKDFYTAFKDHIMKKISLDSHEGRLVMDHIKKYTRYSIAKRKISELTKDKEDK